MNLIGACYNILLRFIKIFKPIYKYIIGLVGLGGIWHIIKSYHDKYKENFKIIQKGLSDEIDKFSNNSINQLIDSCIFKNKFNQPDTQIKFKNLMKSDFFIIEFNSINTFLYKEIKNNSIWSQIVNLIYLRKNFFKQICEDLDNFEKVDNNIRKKINEENPICNLALSIYKNSNVSDYLNQNRGGFSTYNPIHRILILIFYSITELELPTNKNDFLKDGPNVNELIKLCKNDINIQQALNKFNQLMKDIATLKEIKEKCDGKIDEFLA